MGAVAGSKIGRFILAERLGQGGMGSVWVAIDPQLDRKVAVKLISHARSPEAVTRFVLEARTAAKISNPHVTVVYECGETSLDGLVTPYIAMELLAGEDLKARLERGRTLSLDDTARVLAHVAKALSAAHRLGIVHRDIKLDNIVLVPDEEGGFLAKVLDFGIAKSIVEGHGITATGETLGTPQYMSPEQIRGDGWLTPATDLWSLGVVAYRCVTGTLPFSAPSLYALLPAIVEGTFRPASAVNPASPPALDAWFVKALAKAPEQRFGSAMEMAEAFSDSLRRARSAGMAGAPAAHHAPPPEAAAVPTETQSAVGTTLSAGHIMSRAPRPLSRAVILAAAMGGITIACAVVLAGIKLTGWSSRGPSASVSAAAVETGAPTPPAPGAPTPEDAPHAGAAAPAPPAPTPPAPSTTPASTAPSPTAVAADAGAPPAPSTSATTPPRATAPVSKPKPNPPNRRPLGF